MSGARAARLCADALAVLDQVLGEGRAPEAVGDIVVAVGLIEEALEDLEPSGRVASLFLGMPI